MAEHVILVAFTVMGDTRDEAYKGLGEQLALALDDDDSLRADLNPITSCWIAEDDRRDHGDNDSAVFCHKGTQDVANRLLNAADLSGDHNLRRG